MLAFAILLFGVMSRIFIHWPNFTPVIALALFGGLYLGKMRGWITPLLLMVVSDMIIGLHAIVLFTWGSIVLIALLGYQMRGRKNAANLLGTGVLAAVIYFLITNFGAWLVMYPKTAEGFVSCYVAAIPFFRSSLLSTVVYTALFCGLYEAVASTVKNTRFAAILLSSRS
ncbi:MAG: DUF6580 family putative transport protein [Candidatus Omnitrophota bacterium]|jgi:hypothetical protein